MLKTRVIPTMLFKDFGLVKGEQFDGRRAVGSPMQAVKVYNMRGVDELVFVDVNATSNGTPPDFDLIDDLADDCFMPLTVGGGITTTEQVRALLRVGADKVCIGTAAIEHPEIIDLAAKSFGAQCVVAAIDTRDTPDGPEVWIRSGKEPTGRKPVELARELQERGAGEVILTSITRDGMMSGYDLETIADVAAAVSIPVIASGGAGSAQDMLTAVQAGASAVAAASIFHFTEITPHEVKLHLRDHGVAVRV